MQAFAANAAGRHVPNQTLRKGESGTVPEDMPGEARSHDLPLGRQLLATPGAL
jgi:hypothetical protein